jgi:hypothetical protein
MSVGKVERNVGRKTTEKDRITCFAHAEHALKRWEESDHSRIKVWMDTGGKPNGREKNEGRKEWEMGRKDVMNWT